MGNGKERNLKACVRQIGVNSSVSEHKDGLRSLRNRHLTFAVTTKCISEHQFSYVVQSNTVYPIPYFLYLSVFLIQSYWGSGLCPPSGILKTRKTSFLYFRTVDKVQNPSNTDCYTPSPESFRFYLRCCLQARYVQREVS
jgi:hypothetical protein